MKVNMNRMYIDIKESITRNFKFLKAYGFNDFCENQKSYEFHFETKNNDVQIDIWFEAISSSPVWIKINQYYIESIEPENLILKDCSLLREKKYDEFFQQYLKTDDVVYLNKIQKCYINKGKDINELYLNECSVILKRNISILNGNLESLKLNTDEYLIKNKQLKIDERVKNKIYTLEYQFYPKGCIDDAFEEFKSLNELYSFLKVRTDIKNYRILDWNLKIVKMSK